MFGCLESIRRKTSPETLNGMRLSICYTGENAAELSSLDSFLNSYMKLPYSICQMPYSFAKCSNFLAGMAESDHVLFLNDDVVLIDDSITHCLKAVEADEKVGTVGCKLLYPDSTVQHAGQLLVVKQDGSFCGVTHYWMRQPDIKMPDFVSFGNTGAFMLVRKSDFDRLGGFDQGYKHCFEDVDLNMKMLAEGKLNVTCGSVSAWHFESQTRRKAICHEDVNRMIAYYDSNREAVLQSQSILERTIRRHS